MFTKRVTVKRSLKRHVRFVPRIRASSVLGKARTLKMVLHPLWGKGIGDGVSEDDIVLRGLEARGVSDKLYAFPYKSYVQG